MLYFDKYQLTIIACLIKQFFSQLYTCNNRVLLISDLLIFLTFDKRNKLKTRFIKTSWKYRHKNAPETGSLKTLSYWEKNKMNTIMFNHLISFNVSITLLIIFCYPQLSTRQIILKMPSVKNDLLLKVTPDPWFSVICCKSLYM